MLYLHVEIQQERSKHTIMITDQQRLIEKIKTTHAINEVRYKPKHI